MEYFREIEKLTSSNALGWIAASMNLSPRTTKYVRSASCLARPSGWSDRWSWIRLDEKGRDFYEVEAQLLILYQLKDDG